MRNLRTCFFLLFACNAGDIFQLYGNGSIRLVFKFDKITGIHIINRYDDFNSLIRFDLLNLIRACRLYIFDLDRLFNALLAQLFLKIVPGKRFFCE